MPHVVVKLWPGPSEAQKMALAARIVEAVVGSLGSGTDSVSVGIEEIKPDDWMQKVYDRDIGPYMSKLYKRPGYKPF